MKIFMHVDVSFYVICGPKKFKWELVKILDKKDHIVRDKSLIFWFKTKISKERTNCLKLKKKPLDMLRKYVRSKQKSKKTCLKLVKSYRFLVKNNEMDIFKVPSRISPYVFEKL